MNEKQITNTMEPSKRLHFSIEEKKQRLIPLLFERDALIVAKVADHQTFDDLIRLSKIIMGFSKGKPRV